MKNFFTLYLVMPIVWLLFLAVCIVFFIGDLIVWLLTFWWDKRLYILHKYSMVWALFHVWVNPFWRIDFEGAENAQKDKTYIIVSNHQSAFDIVLLYRIKMHFKWVAKRELFRVPFIGWNLWLNKHIVIDRASISGAKKMLLQSQKNISMGNSVLIFPEGTRSKDGAIKRFKDGAFVLAKKTNTTMLPVVINGGKEVVLNNGYALKGSQTFNVKILPEISPESYKNKSIDELGKDVRDIMRSEHMKMAPEYYK
ncbi:MAG TPA: lysophospholipid acyltransferase family protein [Perlabentimonas sp.]|nr:lysophospholipid acyltransferase family protein [Bacteroidales bacterium]MDD4672009.1 lysophospholipid acyltransferase family protein [Bacteroidales bacterium]MDY0349039.1 lysophospholipid acyltransferase family protein [Tenuifilaceae bacterium]HZJ74043.1 lysophospholipid acyltransferase family protein [Perlabentimonas sp.]